jgi:hypothetical protein
MSLNYGKPFQRLWNAFEAHRFVSYNDTPLSKVYDSADDLEKTVLQFLSPDFVSLAEAQLADGSVILPLSCGDFIYSFLIYEPSKARLFFEEYHDRGGIEHGVNKTLTEAENNALKECSWLKLNDRVKRAFRFSSSYAYAAIKPF